MDESSAWPTRLRDLLNPIGKRLGLDSSIEAGRIFSAWTEMVGPDIARSVRPRVLKNGVLNVQTDSAAWAGELRYLAPQLIQQINSFLGRAVVSDLRITQGPLTESADGARQSRSIADPGASSETVEAASDRDLAEPLSALERAREAQRRRRAKRRSDQGF
jgi:predicted nucleic acid-binding Zn ribbon protein